MNGKRTFGRLLFAVALTAAVAGGIWAILPGADVPPERQTSGAVEFVPATGGYHTAWLVAGPLERPLPGPEAAGSPTENGALAGGHWRLVASPESQVRLTADRPGLFYAAGSLVGTGGRRKLLLLASGEAGVWVNGRSLGRSRTGLRWGMHALEEELDLQPGPNPVLVELRADEGRAALLVALRVPGQAGGMDLLGSADSDAPETLSLNLADAGRPRLLELLAASLSLSRPGGEFWAEPGENVALSLSRAASAPRAAGQVSIRVSVEPPPAPGVGPLLPPLELEAGELLSGQREFAAAVPTGSRARVEWRAGVASVPDGAVLACPRLRSYSRGGILAAADGLAGRARELGARQGMNAAALPLLKAEKAGLMLAAAHSAEAAEAAIAEVEQAWRHLEELAAGRDPLAGAVRWVERAYWSEADCSAQPYRLYLPRAMADPAVMQEGGLPLVVYLHGYVPGYDKHRWVEESDMREVTAVMEDQRCVMLMPFGRSNTDFVSIGEVDVLAAIDETCRLYPIDPRRVYLYGYSMGGYGAYALAAHFPDRFAAAVVLAGRPEPYYLEQEALRGRPRARQPAYKGFCLDLDTPIDMAANLRTVPILVCHAKADTLVPAESARRMVAAVRQAGGIAELAEFEGDHWSGFDVLASPGPVRWLLQHTRPERPASVSLRTCSPRYGRAFWAGIERIDRWTLPAELAATEDGQGLVKVRAANVREFTLSRVSAARGLKIEGAEAFEISAVQRDPGLWDVRGRLRTAPPELRWQKTAQLSGPMREACNGPFVVVYDEPDRPAGDGGNGPAPAAGGPASAEARARRFAREWQAFAKGRPPVKCETELTDEDRRTRSIVLFCTPSRSRLLAEAAPTLECRLTDGEFEVAGRKARLGPDRGLVLTRPSPWAPGKDRYLVVCAGLLYGQDLSDNHKLDLVPDFVVYTPESEGQGEPVATLAGFFDSDWKADPGLVEVFDRETPAGRGSVRD